MIDPRLKTIVERQPYPLIFATLSGAHLYGFPSADSDYDLRGVHVLPAAEVVGLEVWNETIEASNRNDGLDLDLVTHDVKKFFIMMLKHNGYVLEQLHSPLVVHSTPEHEELKAVARTCVTRHHSHHYLGFARTEWDLFEKERPRRVKPLLYVYRVLLTGIHLMRTGEIEANLVRLNQEARLPYLPHLIEQKVGREQTALGGDADFEFHRKEYERLRAVLEEAAKACTLPDMPSGKAAMDDLLVRVRLKALK